jgi:hypothetical protein
VQRGSGTSRRHVNEGVLLLLRSVVYSGSIGGRWVVLFVVFLFYTYVFQCGLWYSGLWSSYVISLSVSASLEFLCWYLLLSYSMIMGMNCLSVSRRFIFHVSTTLGLNFIYVLRLRVVGVF